MKIIVALTIAGLFAVTAIAQDQRGMQSMDAKKHRDMMPVHARIMEQQKAQDEEIDKLLATMNTASGEQRIDAMIAVINKLVEQRKAMNAQIAAQLDR